jgi:hypothetical protein
MTRHDCAREQEVVNAVLSGAWPERAGAELTAHASDCAMCGEVATVATLLREDHEQARSVVQVPAAGQVWWRAAVRARLERAQAATQPMTWLHGITAACMAGVALTAITLAWPSVIGGIAWVREQLLDTTPAGDVAGLVTMALGQSLVLGLVAAICLVVAPVVLYFALSDE